MEVIDISLALVEGVRTNSDSDAVTLTPRQRVATDGVNLTSASLGLHTGTHLDAPRHFDDLGAGVESYPLVALIGPGQVVTPSGVAPTVSGLAQDTTTPRLLVKTSGGEGLTANGICESLARILVDAGVLMVGIDGPSIGSVEVHRILLDAGIAIVESLNLGAAEPGPYTVACLPLRLEGTDGAPARVVLIRDL